MPCERPFSRAGLQLPCGKCMPCRLARRRLWVTRQRLEATSHGDNCFVTLTYRDDALPDGYQLHPPDLRDFLKRLRERVKPIRFRFFAVGEYGDASQRPHYHLSVFGLSGHTDKAGSRYRYWGFAREIQLAWALGQTFTVPFSDLTARYVAGYTVKKMTSKDDYRLGNRHPEFARMSNRPGLGVPAIRKLAGTIMSTGFGMQANGSLMDVPTTLTVGSEKLHLGRFLTNKLREAVGLTNEEIVQLRQNRSYERQIELQAMLADKISDEPLTPWSAKKIYQEVNAQKVAEIHARYKIWSQKRGSI